MIPSYTIFRSPMMYEAWEEDEYCRSSGPCSKILLSPDVESQRGAAQLRAAWKREGNPEMARRATREGGATGARWRGVGMDTWRQTMQAMQVAPDDPMTDVENESQRTFTAAGSFDGARPGHVFKNGAHGLGYYRENTTTTDRQKEPRGGRHGWTIAHALIQHMRRKQTRTQERQRAARAAPPAAQEDRAGKGVVVFDVETTKLIGETDSIADLEVSLATALWIGPFCAISTCPYGV